MIYEITPLAQGLPTTEPEILRGTRAEADARAEAILKGLGVEAVSVKAYEIGAWWHSEEYLVALKRWDAWPAELDDFRRWS